MKSPTPLIRVGSNFEVGSRNFEFEFRKFELRSLELGSLGTRELSVYHPMELSGLED